MTRPTVALSGAIALLMTVSAAARAQPPGPKKPGFEVIIPSGTMVPAGPQGEDIKRGNMTAVQVSYGIRPDLVITGTTGWARTRAAGVGNEAKLDVFTYDIGAECRLPRRSSDGRFNVKPFAGVGLGARTYDSRLVDVATTHHLAAYGSAGGEFGLTRVRLRLEVRRYTTWLSTPPSSGAARRSDLAVLAGLRLGLR